MKNIHLIFKTDFLKIIRNPAALLVIAAVIFLPSLYAWFNIISSWDPYANTRGIAIAIANLDEGANQDGIDVNVGNEIVASLKENEKLGWVFVSEDEAMNGVRRGTYYASIVIPADFSSNLLSVITGEFIKPQLDYYINEKINAIAPKVTSAGVSGIVENVSSNFVKTANTAIFDVFHRIGIEFIQNRPDIEKMVRFIFQLEADMPQIEHTLVTAQSDLNKIGEIFGVAEQGLAKVKQIREIAGSLRGQLDALLVEAEQMAADLKPAIIADLQALQKRAREVAAIIDKLAKDQQEQKNQKDKQNQKNQQNEQNQIKQQNQQPAPEMLQVRELMAQMEESISRILQAIDGKLPTNPADLSTTVEQAISRAEAVIQQVNAAFPEIENMLHRAEEGVRLGQGEVAKLREHFPAIRTKLSEIANRIRQYQQSGELDRLIELMLLDPQAEGEFFAHPVELKEHPLFPIPNYGSAMTPFFSTLSLWVGALLLVSLVRVDVENQQQFKSYQVYFGRFLTFLVLGSGQALIVTLGDIFLLKTYVVDKIWFVLFGLFISAIFVMIVYTLVSVFGNVGKAISIVLLVLQLSASGGTFPVQMTPAFFQKIHPFLPFTHAIVLMREAVGGLLWSVAREHMLILCVYIVLCLILGIALKKTFNKSSDRFLEKAKESKLII